MAVAAPEQQYVLTRVDGQHHWCAVGLHAFQYVTDVLRCEVGIQVVDDGALAQVLAAGVGAHGTLVFVFGCVGAVVGANQYDVVVGVAVGFQHLVDTQHVGLVAIVVPSATALHQHGVLVFQLGVVLGNDACLVFIVELLLGIVHHVVPRCQRLRCLGAALVAVVALMVESALGNKPVHIGGVERSGVALRVELYGARCAFESQQLPLFQGGEIQLHAGLAPGVAIDKVVGSAYLDDGIVQAAHLWVVLHVARCEGSQQQGVVEFTLGKGRLGAVACLVAHLESGHRVGIGRKSLIALGKCHASRAQRLNTLFGNVAAGIIYGSPANTQLSTGAIILCRVVGINIPPLAADAGHLINLVDVLSHYKVTDLECQRGQTVEVVAHTFAEVGGIFVLLAGYEVDANLGSLERRPLHKGLSVGVGGRKES